MLYFVTLSEDSKLPELIYSEADPINASSASEAAVVAMQMHDRPPPEGRPLYAFVVDQFHGQKYPAVLHTFTIVRSGD